MLGSIVGFPHQVWVSAVLPILLSFGCGWEREKSFTLVNGHSHPQIELRAWKSKQKATHGGREHTWYHAKSTLYLEELAVHLESVEVMDAPTDAARRARERSFLLEWSGDRRAVMVSVDEGAHWIFAPVDPGSTPFVRDFMIPAADLTHDSLPSFKRLVSAQLGSQTTGLTKSELTCSTLRDCQGADAGKLVTLWRFVIRPEVVEDSAWMLSVLPELVATIEPQSATLGLSTLERACQTNPAVADGLEAMAKQRPQSLPPGALAAALGHRLPEASLDIALEHLAHMDDQDRHDQDTLCGWAIARAAHQVPRLVGARVAEIRELVERLDARSNLNTRRLAIYLVQALTWAQGPGVTEALQGIATPSPERAAALERQHVRIDRSDLVRFPAEYVDPVADLIPQGPDGKTTSELHDWAKAGLRRREEQHEPPK